MDINDLPLASNIAGQIPIFQASGSGAPPTTTYKGVLSPSAIAKLLAVSPITITANATLTSAAYYIPVDTVGGAITLTLPVAPSDGDTILFKDSSGHCDMTKTVSLIGVIDGATNPVVINVSSGFYEIRYNGVTSNWNQIR